MGFICKKTPTYCRSPGKIKNSTWGIDNDITIENKVIVEIKSIEALAPVHYKQVLTYLRLTGIKLGLLINFNEELIKAGIKRIVNGL